MVWVRGTDRYKVGYETKPLGGVLGFLEGVINLGERVIVGPRSKPTAFLGGAPPPPDGERSVEISEPVQIALGSVERLKQQVAELKTNAGELRGTVRDVRRDVDGDPLNSLLGLLSGLLTGLIHRRFAH